eukprot:327411_1
MNVRLSVKCGQSCGSYAFAYTFSCLRGEEVECAKYDGNGKIVMGIGQYTFNDTMRISNKQIRIDGQGYTRTMLTHHVDNGSELINCHFRQCYLTISNISYNVKSSTNNAVIKASNGGNIQFQNVSFVNTDEDTTLTFIFDSESHVLFTNCLFSDQFITWNIQSIATVTFIDCTFKQIKKHLNYMMNVENAQLLISDSVFEQNNGFDSIIESVYA